MLAGKKIGWPIDVPGVFALDPHRLNLDVRFLEALVDKYEGFKV
jgi:hypothetical protein